MNDIYYYCSECGVYLDFCEIYEQNDERYCSYCGEEVCTHSIHEMKDMFNELADNYKWLGKEYDKLQNKNSNK